jgi:hypothetical protein
MWELVAFKEGALASVGHSARGTLREGSWVVPSFDQSSAGKARL